MKPVKLHKEEADETSRFNLYVQTTKKNYFIEYLSSVIIAVSFFLILQLKGQFNAVQLFGFMGLSALTTFRIVEFLLTKKHINRYFFILQEGNDALGSVIVEVLILVMAYYYAIFELTWFN